MGRLFDTYDDEQNYPNESEPTAKANQSEGSQASAQPTSGCNSFHEILPKPAAFLSMTTRGGFSLYLADSFLR